MPTWRTPEAPVHALYRRYMAPRVRALLDFLIGPFEEEGAALEAILAGPAA